MKNMKAFWKKKKLKITITIIIVLVLAIIFGIIVRSGQKKREYNIHIEAAVKYLSELDYEQAIAEYTTAFEIEPRNKEVKEALVNTYLVYADSLVEAGDYAAAISLLQRGYEQTGDERLAEEARQIKLERTKLDEKQKGFLDEMVRTLEEKDAISFYELITGQYETLMKSQYCYDGDKLVDVAETPECALYLSDVHENEGKLWMFYFWGKMETDGTETDEYKAIGKGIGGHVLAGMTDQALESTNVGWMQQAEGIWNKGVPNGKVVWHLTDDYRKHSETENRIITLSIVNGEYIDGIANGDFVYECEYESGNKAVFSFQTENGQIVIDDKWEDGSYYINTQYFESAIHTDFLDFYQLQSFEMGTFIYKP